MRDLDLRAVAALLTLCKFPHPTRTPPYENTWASRSENSMRGLVLLAVAAMLARWKVPHAVNA